MNSGTRAAMTAMLSGEMVTIIGEARWLLLAVTMAVVADFWLGWSESRLRYAKAKRKGDKIVMSQYRWRTSRAWRRTLNKLVDYVVWLALGVFTGMAVLQPLGVDYRMGGVFAAIVAILCEAKSVHGQGRQLPHPLPQDLRRSPGQAQGQRPGREPGGSPRRRGRQGREPVAARQSIPPNM